MKIEVSIDDNVINFQHLSITDFDMILKLRQKNASEYDLTFGSIKSLVGEKIMLEKAFQDEKYESINL